MTGQRCRHFLGMYPDDRPSCAVGRDVRAWAVRCNGGSEHGIALRLPCTKIGDKKPLFDCPSVDRKTDAEVAADRDAMSKHMDRIVAGMGAVNKLKRKMIDGQHRTAKATCPWCGEKGALRLSCAIGVNNHIRANCTSCNEGFIE